MRSLKSVLFLTTLLSSSYAATAVSAQEASEKDEIVIKGRSLSVDELNSVKTPTPIIDVPQSLSIITAEDIAVRGFNSVSDIIEYTPGVNTSQGEGHRDAVVFRGVRSTADFFLDGVRDDVQYYRSFYNLEQVEILRGPNALLFGRGGTGGILNRVTKKGVLGEAFTGYQVGVNSFGGYDAQIDTNFDVSDNAALRINVAYEHLENHRDFFDGDRFGFNPTLRVELSPKTTLDVSYEYVDNERFIDRGIVSDDSGRPVEAFDDITFGDPENNFTTLQAHILRATLQHRFSDNLKGNFTFSYGDYDKVYSNIFPTGFDEALNTVTLDGYIDTTQRENTVIAGNLIGEYHTGTIEHTLVGGLEYIDTTNNNDRFNTFFSTSMDDREDFRVTDPIALRGNLGINAAGDATTNTFSDLNDDTEADIEVFSFYIQDEIQITQWLDLVLGARYDSFDITVDNLETLIDTGVRDIRSRTDEEVSPRVGLIFKPQENISIYGSYSESFLPRSGGQFADINPPDDALDPNTFENLELGLKWDFTSDLILTAAIFEIEQSSPQVSDNNADTLDVIDTTVEGVEVQLQGTITDWWYVSAGYSYLDGAQADESLRPRELPENTFSVWNSFQATDQLGLGIGLTYQDESFADNGNNVTLPSYTRIDASAFYDISEKMRIQLNIENLTDEVYFPNAHTSDNITVGAPINARISLSGKL